MRQIFDPVGWDRKLLVFFGVLALLVLLGPFGSYDAFSVWGRLVYWSSIMCGVGFLMHIIVTTMLGMQNLKWANQFVRIAIGTTLAAIPGAAVVIFVDHTFRENPISVDDFPILWVQVSVMGFFISIIEYIQWGPRETPVESQPTTKFHRRLPSDIGSLISLSMQDHYVEVTGESGKELILMRLSDALGELEGLKGVQVHRSHWVATDHITDLQKARQRWTVGLTDGRRLPVSATYIDKLKAVMP